MKYLSCSATFSIIHVLNRAQLLDDAFNIARSADGNDTELQMYYSRAFQLAKYLQYETEYHPWYTFFVEMQYLMERLGGDTLDALKSTILDIVTPQVTIILSSTDSSLSHTEVLRRNLLLKWACRVGHDGCIDWAKQEYENYKNDTSSIDNNYRDVIVCTALANTNDSKTDFDFVMGLLKQSTLPYEQKDLATALICFENEQWLNQTLLTTIDYVYPPFSRILYDNLLTSLISYGTNKVSTALKFILAHESDILQYWQAINTPTQALKKIGAKIFSEDPIIILQTYINGENSDIKDVAQEIIDMTNENFAWLDKYGAVLTSVLTNSGSNEIISTSPSPNDNNGAEIFNINVLLTATILILIKMLYNY